MLAAAAYLSSLPKSSPDTSFQTTPRPFDITSTKGAFEQKTGQNISGRTGNLQLQDNTKVSIRLC